MLKAQWQGETSQKQGLLPRAVPGRGVGSSPERYLLCSPLAGGEQEALLHPCTEGTEAACTFPPYPLPYREQLPLSKTNTAKLEELLLSLHFA